MSLTQATGKAPRLLDVAGRPVITWRPPSMDAPAEAGEPSVEAAAAGVTVEAVVTPPPALPTAEEIEAIQREAW
ncbi:MAG: hypothetical protein ACP5IY_04360, partial [Halothiobacillaceae bacterium]